MARKLKITENEKYTDVIVNDRQKAAEKQGIQFKSGFIYPKSERYNAYDIGIIINNLLQNALEACERMNTVNRYISITSRQKKKFFLIEVRNSFEGKIVMDADTNLPISTKGNGASGSPEKIRKHIFHVSIISSTDMENFHEIKIHKKNILRKLEQWISYSVS